MVTLLGLLMPALFHPQIAEHEVCLRSLGLEAQGFADPLFGGGWISLLLGGCE